MCRPHRAGRRLASQSLTGTQSVRRTGTRRRSGRTLHNNERGPAHNDTTNALTCTRTGDYMVQFVRYATLIVDGFTKIWISICCEFRRIRKCELLLQHIIWRRILIEFRVNHCKRLQDLAALDMIEVSIKKGFSIVQTLLMFRQFFDELKA